MSWTCSSCDEGDNGKQRVFHACGVHEYHRDCLQEEMWAHEQHRKEHFKKYGFTFDPPFHNYHPPIPRCWPCRTCGYVAPNIVQKRISNRDYICDYCMDIIPAGTESYENERWCYHRFHVLCINHLYPCRECELPHPNGQCNM